MIIHIDDHKPLGILWCICEHLYSWADVYTHTYPYTLLTVQLVPHWSTEKSSVHEFIFSVPSPTIHTDFALVLYKTQFSHIIHTDR